LKNAPTAGWQYAIRIASTSCVAWSGPGPVSLVGCGRGRPGDERRALGFRTGVEASLRGVDLRLEALREVPDGHAADPGQRLAGSAEGGG
jgi:hypothetical protein